MSRQKIEKNVRRQASQLLNEKGYIAPVDLLVRMDRLTSKQVEDWRFTRIPYLERVTVGNLAKLNFILKELRKLAQEMQLKPSKTVYRSWGKGPKKLMRFSKSGNSFMEGQYQTHYVRRIRKTGKISD